MTRSTRIRGCGTSTTGWASRPSDVRRPGRTGVDLAQVYQALLEQDQLAALEVFDRFYETGSHAGLEETRRHLAKLLNLEPSPQGR